MDPVGYRELVVCQVFRYVRPVQGQQELKKRKLIKKTKTKIMMLLKQISQFVVHYD